MTLVLNYGIGSFFTVATSDTRRVRVSYWYDTKTGEFEERGLPPEIENIKAIKTYRVSYFCLLGIGGNAELGEYLRDRLLEEVSFSDDIHACRKTLEAIIEREKKNTAGPDVLKFLEDDYGVMVTLNGFCKDTLKVGMASFVGGKNSKVEFLLADYGQPAHSMITPVKEYENQGKKLFSIPNIDEGLEDKSFEETSNTLLKKVLTHLGTIHSFISYYHPVEVSPDIQYHVLVVKPGVGIEYYVTTDDFTEQHQDFKKSEKGQE